MAQELITILIGAAPVVEIRGAIPVAMAVFHFTPLKAFLLSAFGNLLPIAPLFFGLHYLTDYLVARSSMFGRFFVWLYQRTHAKHSQRFELLGALALFTFVAVPIPGTGVWAGTLAAFVFGIPFKKAFLAISLGAIAAGGIVLLLTLGVLSLA